MMAKQQLSRNEGDFNKFMLGLYHSLHKKVTPVLCLCCWGCYRTLCDELGIKGIAIQRTFDQQAKIFIAQLAFFVRAGKKTVVDFARTVAVFGENGRFLARFRVIIEIVVIAFSGSEAL
jgi:hypothetical protein